MLRREHYDTYDEGVDYKAMYLHMVRAAGAAVDLLIEAMQTCEDHYMSVGDGERAESTGSGESTDRA